MKNIGCQILLGVTASYCIDDAIVHRALWVVDEENELFNIPIRVYYDIAVIFLVRVDRLLEHLNKDVVIVVLISLHKLFYIALTKCKIYYRGRGFINLVHVLRVKISDVSRAAVVWLLQLLFLVLILLLRAFLLSHRDYLCVKPPLRHKDVADSYGKEAVNTELAESLDYI